MTEQPLKWYKEGLRFRCTQCGGCCTGSPGYVWVDEEEISKMADYLGLGLEEFARRFLRRVSGSWSLREEGASFSCPFLKEKKCAVYPARPLQCRTFPWWAENLRDEASWQEAAKRCEGISEEAPLIPLQEIEAHLAS